MARFAIQNVAWHSDAGVYNSVTVGTTATLIVAANDARTSIVIVNNSSQTVFIGQNGGVTGSNGLPLAPGGTFTDDNWTGTIYGIVASGTSDVRYWVVN